MNPPANFAKKEGERMDLWLTAISDIGFPAVIVLYLLNRIEKKLDTLNASIQNLPQQWLNPQTSRANDS